MFQDIFRKEKPPHRRKHKYTKFGTLNTLLHDLRASLSARNFDSFRTYAIFPACDLIQWPSDQDGSLHLCPQHSPTAQLNLKHKIHRGSWGRIRFHAPWSEQSFFNVTMT